jgi:hypothetical protein
MVHGGTITRDPGPETVCIDLSNEVVVRETKQLIAALLGVVVRLDTPVWTPEDAAAYRLWVAHVGDDDDFRNVAGYPVPTGEGIEHMLEAAGWPDDPMVAANLPQLTGAVNRARAMEGEAFRFFPVYVETSNPSVGPAPGAGGGQTVAPPSEWRPPSLPGGDDGEGPEPGAPKPAGMSPTTRNALLLFGAGALLAYIVYMR